jgi:hypothetical protein
MNARAMVLALVMMVLTACGGSMTVHPIVWIDSSFTVDEMTEIDAGLTSWETSGVDVRFERRIIGHADIIGAALDHPANSIFVAKLHGTHGADCPTPPRADFDGNTAVTYSDYGSSTICIDVDYADAHPIGWRGMVAHELGHVFGLSHDSHRDSVMFPIYVDQSAEVTCRDVQAFSAAWGQPVPARCTR